MKRIALFAAALAFLLLAGCRTGAILYPPPIATETVVHTRTTTVLEVFEPDIFEGKKVWGEVVFGVRGGLPMVADVMIDGVLAATIPRGVAIPWLLTAGAWHRIYAVVYLYNPRTAERLGRWGCYSREFLVPASHRTNTSTSFWWREDISPSPHC